MNIINRLQKGKYKKELYKIEIIDAIDKDNSISILCSDTIDNPISIEILDVFRGVKEQNIFRISFLEYYFISYDRNNNAHVNDDLISLIRSIQYNPLRITISDKIYYIHKAECIFEYKLSNPKNSFYHGTSITVFCKKELDKNKYTGVIKLKETLPTDDMICLICGSEEFYINTKNIKKITEVQ